MKKIVIAGGTGFIGSYLKQRFEAEGNEVKIISRQKGFVNWDDVDGIVSALNGANLLINLAGKSVDCRYNKKNREEILMSRTETTNKLASAIPQCAAPPLLWINAGTATIYRHALDRPMTEAGGEIGEGFSVNVAKAWEAAFFRNAFPLTRQVMLRVAIVLGKEGGVMKPLQNLVRLGLGGKQGKGQQMFSWIHVDDLYRMILFIERNQHLKGVFNASSPNPVTNEKLMRALRTYSKISIGLPTPQWLLEIGARFINTETELVLKSRWVLPERLVHEGFTFEYPQIEDALASFISR